MSGERHDPNCVYHWSGELETCNCHVRREWEKALRVRKPKPPRRKRARATDPTTNERSESDG